VNPDDVVEESNAGAKQHGREVDVDLVEPPGIQQLLNGVGAVDPYGGLACGLLHGPAEPLIALHPALVQGDASSFTDVGEPVRLSLSAHGESEGLEIVQPHLRGTE
jgi:hypothetical protein